VTFLFLLVNYLFSFVYLHLFLCLGMGAVEAAEGMRGTVQAADPRVWDRCLFFRLYVPASRPLGSDELSGLREVVAPASVSVVPCVGLGGNGASCGPAALLLECVVLPLPPQPTADD
jgi:hypothetical protein